MPLYEYECESCGSRFERIQKFSDPPVAVCPTCGGSVRKLVSSPAIQFKGSGFYITDYPKSGSGGGKSDSGDKSGSKSDKAASAAPSSSSSSDSSSSEPAKKAEPSKTEAPSKPAGKPDAS